MYSYGFPHMAAQKQDDQHERTFSSYVRIQVVVLKTYLGRWTIGRSGERGSGISVLPARYDDDDDIYIYNICLHIPFFFKLCTLVQVLVLPFTFLQFYSVVSQDSKVNNLASSLFLLIIISSGLLAEIRWFVCMSKSHRSLCVPFFMTDAGLCIYKAH